MACVVTDNLSAGLPIPVNLKATALTPPSATRPGFIPLPRPAPPRVSVVSRILLVLAWLVALALAFLAVLRFAFHDGTDLLASLNSFTRYLYLPAYPCLCYAIAKRQRLLAVLSAVVIGCHVWWLVPDFVRDRRFDSITAPLLANEAAAGRVRIFFANVHYHNNQPEAILREVEATDPDLVILIEFPWSWREPFLASTLRTRYPHGRGFKPWQVDRVAVFSRLTVRGEHEDSIENRIIETTEVEVGDNSLKIVGLHAHRPMNFSEPGSNAAGYWAKAVPLILATPRPLVVIGDFNATQYSLVHKQLKSAGLRSAHEDRGRGYATTWPNGMVPVPPIRIDQAYLSPEVACRAIGEGIGLGSDHKPLILDVVVAPRP